MERDGERGESVLSDSRFLPLIFSLFLDVSLVPFHRFSCSSLLIRFWLSVCKMYSHPPSVVNFDPSPPFARLYPSLELLALNCSLSLHLSFPFYTRLVLFLKLPLSLPPPQHPSRRNMSALHSLYWRREPPAARPPSLPPSLPAFE